MLGLLYAAFYIAIALKWGDIKGWKKYYSTILFFILGDMLYQWLFTDFYPMWRFSPYGIDVELGVTNTFIALSIMLIKYPAIILVYLHKFPTQLKSQIIYILLWTLLISINELLTLSAGGIIYYNGWSYAWSVLFALVMFIILRVHFLKPLLGIGLSFVFIVFLWIIFDVPNDVVFR